MQHKCKVTIIDKKCFNDYQEKYLADPKSGPCPFYNVGDEFIFERYGGDDTFWRTGTASAAIFTRRFRAAALCAAGLTMNA